MIGIARRILDAMLSANTRLTNEVLTTLMGEVTAIMNARPLVPISTDYEKTEILTPAMLLTQKACAVSAPPGEFSIKDMYKCTSVNGSKFRILQIHSGNVGNMNSCLHFRLEGSGQMKNQMSKKEMLCC